MSSTVTLEDWEREQLIDLLVDANGDYSTILFKLGFNGKTINGDQIGIDENDPLRVEIRDAIYHMVAHYSKTEDRKRRIEELIEVYPGGKLGSVLNWLRLDPKVGMPVHSLFKEVLLERFV